MKIGFVTCQESILTQYFPTKAEPDFISPEQLFTPDDYIAVKDLRAHGHDIPAIIWGAAPETLSDLDLIIVRSPWDYAHTESNKINFFVWLDTLSDAGLPVANPPPLMRWLLDKYYLEDLAKQGVNIIPTEYLPAGSNINLSETFTARGPFVLKQCISAGGSGLFFIDSLQAAEDMQESFNQLISSAAYMLQPFIPEIVTNGEWSLTFFGGKYSHSILKKAGENSILIHADHGGSLHFPVHPPAAVVEFAQHVYQKIIPAYEQATGFSCPVSQLLYMRIDVIETESGPVLIECEGVEPELFFRAKLHSEAAFRKAVENII